MEAAKGLSTPAAPDDRVLAERYVELEAAFDRAEAPRAQRGSFDEWDRLRREWRSWASFTRLRFTQDTRRDDCRAAQVELDQRTPGVTALDVAVKKRLLVPDLRRPLQDALGAQAFDLWQGDIASFDPAIADALVRESALMREYTELLAGASVEFAGAPRTLAELGTFRQSSDREQRHGAERARWQIFSERRE